MTDRDIMQQALEALELHGKQYPHMVKGYCLDAITALREALAEQPAQQENSAYSYAFRLASAIWVQHYKDVAPRWKPLDNLIGILTQIDNMTSGLSAQRTWVGLTNEEIENAISDGFARGLDDGNVSNKIVIQYVRVIEATLKERNHG